MSRYEIHTAPALSTVRIYDTAAGESFVNKTGFTASFLLTDLGMDECSMNLMQGSLNHEINTEIFKFLKSEGFIRVQYEVPAGSRASRLGVKVKTTSGLDRYVVDLTKEI